MYLNLGIYILCIMCMSNCMRTQYVQMYGSMHTCMGLCIHGRVQVLKKHHMHRSAKTISASQGYRNLCFPQQDQQSKGGMKLSPNDNGPACQWWCAMLRSIKNSPSYPLKHIISGQSLAAKSLHKLTGVLTQRIGDHHFQIK